MIAYPASFFHLKSIGYGLAPLAPAKSKTLTPNSETERLLPTQNGRLEEPAIPAR